MDASAITKITELAKPNIEEINGRTYSDKSLTLVAEPACQSAQVHTLRGLVSIVKSEHDKLASPLYVSVDSYYKVKVFTTLSTSNKTRDTLCEADSETNEINFGHPQDYEEMIIKLRTRFEQTEDTEYLRNLLANITDEQSVQTLDDGITQNAVVRKGISLKEHKNIKPIVKLKPYRTFLEVEQPESEFLFRLRGSAAILFEADGGAWKLTARKNIAEYLRQELSELIEEGKVIVIE